ncbi:MAG: uroporphyrinogen-III synthase [Frankiaceae bacterium]
MTTGGVAGADSPLAGFTVGITAARRRQELADLLERRGARVVTAPAIRIVPLADDADLLRATRDCLAAPPDLVVATTGIGFRGWLEAAYGWGLGESLLDRLGAATLLARGPKARGAVRSAGLRETWSPESESMSEVLAHLLDHHELAGRRVAVQLHGEPLPNLVEALTAAGAHVVPVPVYRWAPPADIAPLIRLVELICGRAVDAVAFTSAPAAASLLATAADLGRCADLVQAVRGDVLAACVGPVTAAPLTRLGVPVVMPTHYRLGALVREIVEALPARARPVRVAGSELSVRGSGVLRDGVLLPVPRGSLAVLRALVAQPGRVVPRAELLAALSATGPGPADEHALEAAVNRLRAALGQPSVVQTVIKRGYRLAVPAPTSDVASRSPAY